MTAEKNDGIRSAALGFAIALVVAGGVRAESARVLAEWKFDRTTQWNGWSPGGLIRDAAFEADGVRFNSTGSDPIIVGPLFDLATASNNQWVEIDLDCTQGGNGELFYTNTTEGRYGGFDGKWMSAIVVPAGAGQTVSVWPFWSSLGKIVRVRFDPPAGDGIKLRAIRVMEVAGQAPAPSWTFGEQGDSWRSLYAAELERTPEGLKVRALKPQAVIITPVAGFDAARCSLLTLDASCTDETSIGLYWATQEHQGLYGESVDIASECKDPTDLRRMAEWTGTVTHLAIAFGTKGGEELTLRSFALAENDPGKTRLRARYRGFDRGAVRPDQNAVVRLIYEHAGGPAMAAGKARISWSKENAVDSSVSELAVPALEVGGKAELRLPVRTRKFGVSVVTFGMPNGQDINVLLHVLQPLAPELLARPDGYDVPPPRPAKTDYQIGVYYFPGWSADQMNRWVRQADWPERDSLLGWYEEGRPEVADWHIKWAVENGISFFVYDWYWRDGKEQLGAGLNEGFLEARYNQMMKFAIMWANHPPYSSHTHEQLLTVTDYWIERYFRRPNYLTVDGKPYVSFFSTGDLISDMGSEDNVRAAFDAMRARAREAGLPGIHFAACTGGDSAVLESLKRAGFDSVTAYNYVQIDTVLEQSPYKHYMLAHEGIWKRMSASGVLPYVPLLTVNWDARPWHGPRTKQKFDRYPTHFAEGLKRLRAHLDHTGQKMAILEAWNEWGEGSYLEPNVEFGFDDLDALSRVFTELNLLDLLPLHDNVSPYDVGLDGKYDLRRRVLTAGRHPAVLEGIEVVCRGDRLWVAPGRYRHEGRECRTPGGEVHVPPPEALERTASPLKLVAGDVKMWQGGNRLVIGPDDRRNLLPDSFVPGSLRLEHPQRPDLQLCAPQDYVVDFIWGAFALSSGSRLAPGETVHASYRLSLRRVDALVLEAQGKPGLIHGSSSADCPELPEIPPGAFLLAHVYRPFNVGKLEPAHIYVPGAMPSPAKVQNTASLEPVLRKLRGGEKVTIVCWGDSVTVGGDASTPEKGYVGLFEAMLKERFARAQVQVINAGIGGSSSHGRLADFQAEVLDHRPDVVTLEFVNDMPYPLADMQSRYAEILERTRAAGAALVLITPHYTRPDWMGVRTARVPADPRPNVGFLRRFAAENQVPLADAARRWEELDPQAIPYEILLRNGINHPDDRGHRFFAEELLRLFD